MSVWFYVSWRCDSESDFSVSVCSLEYAKGDGSKTRKEKEGERENKEEKIQKVLTSLHSHPGLKLSKNPTSSNKFG